MRKFTFILMGTVAAVAMWMSFYAVDASEFVYVTVLGQHVATHDGKGDGGGLHFGWPWPIRRLYRFDRRLQTIDLPAVELVTPDKEKKKIDQTLSVEAYLCWRIADVNALEQFIQNMGTVERAQDILRQRFNSLLGATITRRRVQDLINTYSGRAPDRTLVDDNMDDLHRELMSAMSKTLREKDGIELIDIRLRRFYHPTDVRSAIFERIKSERQDLVVKHRSEGELEAKNEETRAREAAGRLENQAQSETDRLKREAEAEAARLAQIPASRDPEFYTLLKSLEHLERLVGETKPMVLSTRQWFVKLLDEMPRLLRDPKKAPSEVK